MLGLCDLHKAGIAHRDVTEENVLSFKVASESSTGAMRGTSKKIGEVCDLGLASAIGSVKRISGTPRSRIPELVNHHQARVSASQDMWALGVLMVRCVTVE